MSETRQFVYTVDCVDNRTTRRQCLASKRGVKLNSAPSLSLLPFSLSAPSLALFPSLCSTHRSAAPHSAGLWRFLCLFLWLPLFGSALVSVSLCLLCLLLFLVIFLDRVLIFLHIHLHMNIFIPNVRESYHLCITVSKPNYCLVFSFKVFSRFPVEACLLALHVRSPALFDPSKLRKTI